MISKAGTFPFTPAVITAVNPSCQPVTKLFSLVFSLVILVGLLGPVTAAPIQDQQLISVTINKSRILDLREPIARVSVANPAIADILVINPKQIYINGKTLGTTNMILWDEQGQVVRQIGLEVTQDIEALKEKLYRLLPAERIKVESARGVIVLSGTVSSPARMDAALRLAKAFSGEEETSGGGSGESAKVVNLMQVGGAQQVLLEVKVAEVNRTLGKSLDSSFLGIYDGGSVKIGLSRNLTKETSLIRGEAGEIISDAITPGDVFGNIIGSGTGTGLGSLINSGNFSASLFLQLAEEEGQARILAEPNLTTLSGQEAEFLSGGQLPYTSCNQGSNTSTCETEFKDYGIKLKFIPFVMDSSIINLKVNVSVSEPGPEVITGGQLSTSILSRGANATVEVPSGQVIAIAGLLSERSSGTVNEFPGLGNIPVLGALFRGNEMRKEQKELVIFVTPRLANSFSPQQVKLPTEGFVEPTDVEFYLLGKLPSQGKRGGTELLAPDKKGSEGLFGHDL